MKIGCCCNMISTKDDGTGIEWIEVLAASGYDYVELPLAQIMDLSELEFSTLLHRLRSSGLSCEAANNFFPASVRLTGEDVKQGIIQDYLEKALDRAVQLGVKVIVFGSSKAKNVPQGYPMPAAWTQIVELLQYVDSLVAPKGITIAIEPLNHMESNIVNTIADGLALVQDVNKEHVRLLVDYYHMVMEHENIRILAAAGQNIRHVHFAEPHGRKFPTETSTEYCSFFSMLKTIGYKERVSIEAFSCDQAHDTAMALRVLQRLI